MEIFKEFKKQYKKKYLKLNWLSFLLSFMGGVFILIGEFEFQFTVRIAFGLIIILGSFLIKLKTVIPTRYGYGWGIVWGWWEPSSAGVIIVLIFSLFSLALYLISSLDTILITGSLLGITGSILEMLRVEHIKRKIGGFPRKF